MKKITQFSILRAICIALLLFSMQTVNAIIIAPLTIDVVNANNNFIDSSESTDSLLDLFIDFDINKVVTLEITPGMGGSSLDFKGVFQNSSSIDWQSFNVMLTGDAKFTDSDDIIPQNATLGPVSRSNTEININFILNGEDGGLEIGSLSPWQIDIGALSAGNSFGLVVTPEAVPIPAAAWLFGSGLIGLFARVRQRKN